VVQHLLDEEVLVENEMEVEQIGKLQPRARAQAGQETVDAELLRACARRKSAATCWTRSTHRSRPWRRQKKNGSGEEQDEVKGRTRARRIAGDAGAAKRSVAPQAGAPPRSNTWP
jgi:hypothetical protein